jgi:3-oxoacyl-[acyl-carrier-protein] synthase III
MGLYLPDEYMTGEEIAEIVGIPTHIVEEKMGIKKKHVPGDNDHTCEMGILAAKQAIERAGIDPLEIDVVIYIGEEHKEYPLWTAGIKLQEAVGALNAWAFDVALRCGTTVMALKVAKSLMMADPTIKTVLLAGGYRNVDFIDYQNPRTRFMFNLGAGGGAILLKKDHNENVLLETELITDGSFSEDVVVVSGGTKHPITKEAIEHRLNKLDVLDPDGMKQRLEQKSMVNFIKVIRESVRKSGYKEEDISYLSMLHMKRSAHEYVLKELGLSPEQSIYLEEYGHIGQIDQILSLELALKEGKVSDGDLVVFVSAGIGYAWGATAIKWGKVS